MPSVRYRGQSGSGTRKPNVILEGPVHTEYSEGGGVLGGETRVDGSGTVVLGLASQRAGRSI